jgi:hypothetical protein
MKNKFIIILILFVLFEWMRVYFIMPMPGSQRINSINVAYTLHSIRWFIRLVLSVVLILFFKQSWKQHKISTSVGSIILIVSIYLTNFPMSADTMFKKITEQNFASKKGSLIDTNRLIIGVIIGNEARAYPINIIAHHHQVKDIINGQDVLVTYCSVCRTGRAYSPSINGKITDFRLVGMDHFNAMFEDPETKSWWRQVNGECIAGKLKGKKLEEIQCYQTTLKTWLALYPNSLILQEDSKFKEEYKELEKFDDGSYNSSLTGRDKKPKSFKSWVVWVKNQNQIAVADWSEIEKNNFVIKEIGSSKNLIISNDKQSIFAFDLTPLTKAIDPQTIKTIKVQPSTFEIVTNLGRSYIFNYKGIEQNSKDSALGLPILPCTQEFRHSFIQFQQNPK